MISLGLFAFSSRAQTIYIPPEGHVYSFAPAATGLFEEVVNEGSFGSMPGSVIYFLGKKWENGPGSTLPGKEGDNTPGGLFRFTGGKRQWLAGGYNIHAHTGPSFPNLAIENPAGVWLKDFNDLRIRGNLDFNKGFLYLNGWNVLVEDSISGYSDNGFVVTGGNIGGGSLYREPSIATYRRLVFPIGTSPESYSPLEIKIPQPSDREIGVTVFDHVFQEAVAGSRIDTHYVKKTWQVKSIQGAGQAVEIYLQHKEEMEGELFSRYRDSSYISLYYSGKAIWDMDTLTHDVTNPGRLTMGQQHGFTWGNNRTFPEGIPLESPDSVSWLSISSVKYSNSACPLAVFRLWEAERYNFRWVQLFWRTHSEMNVDRYEVQRRRDTATKFKTVATFASKEESRSGKLLNYYYYADENPYSGWTDYRLKILSYSGCIVYTEAQAVPLAIEVRVWPNPSPKEVYVRVRGMAPPALMQVVDVGGRILRSYTVNRDGVFEVQTMADGIYFLVFRNPKDKGKKITTVKLVVHHSQ